MSETELDQISNPTKEGQISDPTPEGDVSNATLVDDVTLSDPTDGVADDHPTDADTFPREYVQRLRDENAKYRQRAQDRDEVAAKLHTTLVAATGRLQDPTDLAFNEDHLDHPDNMIAAIDALLEAKPHLASRKPTGDIGQGVSVASDTFSLLGALRTNAS